MSCAMDNTASTRKALRRLIAFALGASLVGGMGCHRSEPNKRQVDLWLTQLREGSVAQQHEALGRLVDNHMTAARPLVEELLAHGKGRQRLHAARALGTLGSASSVGVLAEALESRDPELQLASIRALGQLGAVQAIPPLLTTAATTGNAALVEAACHALLQIGPVAAPSLGSLAASTHAPTAATAIQALATMTNASVEAELTTLLEAPLPDIALDAADELRLRGSTNALPYLAELAGRRNSPNRARVLESIHGYGPDAVPYATAILNSHSSKGRQAAIDLLRANINEPKSKAALLAALEHRDRRVRRAAGEALAELAESESGQQRILATAMEREEHPAYHSFIILRTLDAASTNMTAPLANAARKHTEATFEPLREIALLTLAEAPLPDDRKAFQAALEDPSEGIQAAAEVGLAKLGDRTPIPLLLKSLRQCLGSGLVKDPERAQLLIRTLADLHVGEAVPLLVQTLAVDDQETRATAAEALGRLGNHQALQPLLGLLGQQDPQSTIRARIIDALGQLGAGKARRALEKQLHANSPTVVLAAIAALQSLGQREAFDAIEARATTPNPGFEREKERNIRMACAAALTSLDGERATATIAYLIEREPPQNTEVLDIYCSLLADIGDPAATPSLVQLLTSQLAETRNTASDAIAAFGPPAYPYLLTSMDTPRTTRRTAIAKQLARAGKDAMGTLTQGLENPSSLVQQGALLAMAQIPGAPLPTHTIVRLMKQGPPQVRGVAAWTLGMHVATDHIADIIPLLVDPDASVRRYAEKALEQMPQERVQQALQNLLYDNSPLVREAAIRGLTRFGDADALGLLYDLADDPDTNVAHAVHSALNVLEALNERGDL